MKTAQKCLFGGALIAAGVTANAQSFIFADSGDVNDNYGVPENFPSLAYLVDIDTGDSNVAYAPDSLTTSLSSNYLDLSTTQQSNLLRIGGSWNGVSVPGGNGADGDRGYGGGFLQQFFEVDQDSTLVISWDVTSTDLFNSGLLITTPDGATLFELDTLNVDAPTGSVNIPLQADQGYAAILSLELPGFFGPTRPFFEVAGQEAFIQAELIPAPGAAGLMGLAGLAAVRRRRA